MEDFKSVEIPEANTTFIRKIPEQVIEYCDNLLLISDPHFPYHDERLFRWMVSAVEPLGLKTCLWNGDMLNNGHRGHRGAYNIREASFDEGLEKWIRAMKALTIAGIEHHILHPGNHDDKVWRDGMQEMTFLRFWRGFVADAVAEAHAKFTVGQRYYTIMENPHGPAFRFTHQFGYSKIPTRVAQRIWTKYPTQHIFTGHQHHAARAYAPDAVHQLVDLPMAAERELLEYTNMRDTDFPLHKTGFTVLRHGVPEFFLTDHSDAWWRSRLGVAEC